MATQHQCKFWIPMLNSKTEWIPSYHSGTLMAKIGPWCQKNDHMVFVYLTRAQTEQWQNLDHNRCFGSSPQSCLLFQILARFRITSSGWNNMEDYFRIIARIICPALMLWNMYVFCKRSISCSYHDIFWKTRKNSQWCNVYFKFA